MRARVLVVDDDPALAEMLGIVLRSEGFLPSFVADGERALAAFRDSRPDIVLLDLMLPGMSGIDVCRADPGRVRRADRHADRQERHRRRRAGLESGADDYVVKPFKPKELVARMRARLRRGEDAAPEMLTIGPPGNQITIDVPAHTVSRDGEEIKLTPLEFDLLVALARKPRQVFTREVLLEQVWGYRHAADTRLVNVHVQRLRAKIEPDPERPEIVLTVRGVGYKAGTGLSLAGTARCSADPDTRPRRSAASADARRIRARWPAGSLRLRRRRHRRWRRSLQLRVVAITLVASGLVVGGVRRHLVATRSPTSVLDSASSERPATRSQTRRGARVAAAQRLQPGRRPDAAGHARRHGATTCAGGDDPAQLGGWSSAITRRPAHRRPRPAHRRRSVTPRR